MRLTILLAITVLFLRAALPIRLDDSVNLISPVTNADGNSILFAAGSPPGVSVKGSNLYQFVQASGASSVRALTKYTGDSNFTGVSGVALAGGVAVYTALPSGPGGAEEIHVLDLATLADRNVATDKEGCIQPLCIGCFRSCIGPVHVSPNGSSILYYAARERPFYLANADGTGVTRMPVYSGQLAPSAQRVFTRDGALVFTSAAPSGPTFAAAATEVYVINSDGTGLRQVTKFGDARFYARDAVVSADGSLIAFETNYSPAGTADANQIWAVRSDGTGLTVLSRGPDPAYNASISADGSTVTFLQGGQIRSVRTRDSSLLALTHLTLSAPFDPVLSDDGSKVVFTVGPQSGGAAAVYRIPAGTPTEFADFYPVYLPRYVNPAGVVSAAGNAAPSPGSLITLYGSNLGRSESQQAAAFPLPTTLNEVTLMVNGQVVPLLTVTPWQINAQLPQTVPPGNATFQVFRSGSTSAAPVEAEVKRTAPAAFTYPFVNLLSYYTQATAYHAGTGIAADMAHPASAGETLEIYCAGFGMTDPLVDAGKASPSAPPARAVQTPQPQIGGIDATVTFAGLAPGFAGVYQLNVVVPKGLEPGLQPLGWKESTGVLNAWLGVK